MENLHISVKYTDIPPGYIHITDGIIQEFDRFLDLSYYEKRNIVFSYVEDDDLGMNVTDFTYVIRRRDRERFRLQTL